MKVRMRLIGVLTILVLALLLVPTAAMGAPAITQGVRGVVMDAVNGVPIPFAPLVVQVDAGPPSFIEAEYDGTYSFTTPVSPNVVVTAIGIFYEIDASGALSVGASSVVIQDFSLDRSSVFSQPVYRFFNMKGGVHFYTANNAEFINTYKNLSSIYSYDGVAYYVPWGESSEPGLENPNTFPLYRFYNRTTGVHFFTMSEQEKANVIATRSDDYTFEGVAYWVSDRVIPSDIFIPFMSSGFPVYRFYVPARDAHFFTSNSNEIFLFPSLSNEYHSEGVGFYINGWRSVETDSIAE